MNKITDAILYRLKELRLRVSNLVTSKRFTEMSDDRAYSNGRMAEYDRDIAQAKANLASWYSQSPLELTNGDLKLIVELQDGYTFALKIMDFSRPGVLRSIAYGFTDDDRGVPRGIPRGPNGQLPRRGHAGRRGVHFHRQADEGDGRGDRQAPSRGPRKGSDNRKSQR